MKVGDLVYEVRMVDGIPVGIEVAKVTETDMATGEPSWLYQDRQDAVKEMKSRLDKIIATKEAELAELKKRITSL